LTVNRNVGATYAPNPALIDNVAMVKQRSPHAVETGKRIRALRKRFRMTQAELAEQIGVERATLTGIELGNHPPGRSTLVALASVLGVSMDYIETGVSFSGDNDAAQSLKAKQDAELLAIWAILEPHEKAATLNYLEGLFGGRLRVSDGHEASSAVNT
jgi:transcriptional regulator with XRE-family HTH domain